MMLEVMIMSGPDDGTTFTLSPDSGNGQQIDGRWELIIGRREENDVPLPKDTFASRRHALLIWQDRGWWLHDNNSKNRTFLEDGDGGDDIAIDEPTPLQSGQLFRVGRTWLRLQAMEA